MPYLIDGHNLIPKIPGLSLSQPDDEARLVTRVQEYCRLTRKEAEIFFDNAPLGHPRSRSYARVKVYFTPAGQTADNAIRNRLQRLGRTAPNWTVVSSDFSVQTSARQVRAGVQSSEAFAAELQARLEQGPTSSGKNAETTLSPDEVEEWLAVFKKKPKGQGS